MNLWDGCLTLALDKRKEHWNGLLQSFNRFNVNPELYICGDGSDKTLSYDQIDVENPDVSQWIYGVPHLKHHHWNALLSHKGMIRKAIVKGWKSVLFLEDDAFALNRFNHVLYNSPVPKDWDLLYLGFWRGSEDDEYNVGLENDYKNGKMGWQEVKGNTIGGFHSVIIRESVYEFILNCPFVNPLDTQIGYNRDYFKSYILTPKITHVRNIHSFTEGVVIQRKELE